MCYKNYYKIIIIIIIIIKIICHKNYFHYKLTADLIICLQPNLYFIEQDIADYCSLMEENFGNIFLALLWIPMP